MITDAYALRDTFFNEIQDFSVAESIVSSENVTFSIKYIWIIRHIHQFYSIILYCVGKKTSKKNPFLWEDLQKGTEKNKSDSAIKAKNAEKRPKLIKSQNQS